MLCEGKKIYAKPGTCPVCHMYLSTQKDAEDDSGKPLSSIEYRVELKLSPPEPKINETFEMILIPYLTKDNSVLRKFEGEDKARFPIDLVLQDLSSIQSLVALADKEGTYRVKTMLPAAGNYIAYVRLTPAGNRKQVFPLAIKIAGPAKKEVPLKLLSQNKSTMGTRSVSLGVHPNPQLYKYSHLKFELPPILLASSASSSRLVLISEDTTWYFEEEKELKLEKMKATVEFYARFPKQGNYKLWLLHGAQNAEFRLSVR